MRLCRARLLTVWPALLLLCGCAGHGAAQGPPPAPTLPSAPESGPPLPALLTLPPPSVLTGLAKYQRRASYVEADLTHNGADFSPALPSRNVTVNSTALDFAPAWSGPADGAGKLALATYTFNAPGYDREPLLRSSWSAPPATASELWFGLANWTLNRWDWRHASSALTCTPPSLAPYLNFTGQLVVVVLRTGTDASTLASIRLGSPVPNAVLSATPNVGVPPLSVSLDASASTPTQGTLVQYEFDKGDGIFVDNGSNPVFPTEYDSAGAYTARVRVSDSLGARAIATRTVNVSGAWSHNYSRGFYDEVYGLLAAAAGDYYAVGISEENIGHAQATVWKYNGVGDLLWVKAFSSPDNAQFDCITSDPDGNLLLAGHTLSGLEDPHAIIQAWSPEGQVLWAKKLTCNGAPSFSQIMCSGSNIYLTGTREALVFSQDSDALLLCLGLDGSLVWDRNWAAAGDKQADLLYSGGLAFSEFAGGSYVVGVGLSGLSDSDIPSFQPSPLLLVYNLDGNLVNSKRLGDGSLSSWFTALRVKTGKAFSTLEIAGHAPAGGPQAGFVIQCGLSGTVSGSGSWVVNDGSGNTYVEPSAVLLSSAVAGVVVLSSEDGHGLVTSLDPATSGVGVNKRWDASSAGGVVFKAGASLGDGSLLAGGSSAITAGAFGDVGFNAGSFAYAFEDLPGTDSEAFMTVTDDTLVNEALTSGQLDTISGGPAALIMHVMLP